MSGYFEDNRNRLPSTHNLQDYPVSNELREIIRALETDGSRSDSLILMGRIVGVGQHRGGNPWPYKATRRTHSPP
jgi:hypothetical protein